jgi:uncharacterized membrane protein
MTFSDEDRREIMRVCAISITDAELKQQQQKQTPEQQTRASMLPLKEALVVILVAIALAAVIAAMVLLCLAVIMGIFP